jgi:hypothetical protein
MLEQSVAPTYRDSTLPSTRRVHDIPLGQRKYTVKPLTPDALHLVDLHPTADRSSLLGLHGLGH